MRTTSMPGNQGKRKGPLVGREMTPEEWDALGLPNHELIISPVSGKPSGTQPQPATKTSKTRPKPPKPRSKNP